MFRYSETLYKPKNAHLQLIDNISENRCFFQEFDQLCAQVKYEYISMKLHRCVDRVITHYQKKLYLVLSTRFPVYPRCVEAPALLLSCSLPAFNTFPESTPKRTEGWILRLRYSDPGFYPPPTSQFQ